MCGGVQGKGWTAREVVASVGGGEGALHFSRLILPALTFDFLQLVRKYFWRNAFEQLNARAMW